MTIQEFAAMLNNRTYGNEISDLESESAKKLGFVIAFGASDDLLELRGAIYDEFGAWDGTEILVTNEGKVYDPTQMENGELEIFKELRKHVPMMSLKAVWSPPDGSSWCILPGIPEQCPFQIFEDGELYGTGAVFALSSITEVLG